MASFVYLLLLGELMFTYFMSTCARTSGDIMRSHALTCSPTLYVWNSLIAHFYTHLPK